jgi:hypothetical protein
MSGDDDFLMCFCSPDLNINCLVICINKMYYISYASLSHFYLIN